MYIVDRLNELIEEENGTAISSTQAIVESGIDSFGLIMVLNSIDEEYKVWTKEEFKELPFEKLTIQDIVNKINDSK